MSLLVKRKRVTLTLKWWRQDNDLLTGEKGIGLIEVLIAVALIASAIVAMISAMDTGGKSVILTDKKVTARSLAEAQMEYIMSFPYSGTPVSYSYPPNSGTPAYPRVGTPVGGYRGFQINVKVGTVSASILPGTTTFMGAEIPDNTDSVEEITVTIDRQGKRVYELSSLKGNR